jgi:hypothetical protein
MRSAVGGSVFLAALAACTPGLAQTPELQISASNYRSMQAGVTRLREKTGWPISREDAVWPQKSTPGPDAYVRQDGTREQPPDKDQLRVSLSLIGPGARQRSVAAMVSAYNAQDAGTSYRAIELGVWTVLLPETIRDGHGASTTARSILDVEVSVPIAGRSPMEHLQAITQAVGSSTGIPVDASDAGFGFRFDEYYAGPGKVDPEIIQGKKPREQPRPNWGTTGFTTARAALADFLSRSRTTTVWDVACQVGITGGGICVLNVLPIQVEIKDRAGNLTKRLLLCDRGCPGFNPLPPPPPRPKTP